MSMTPLQRAARKRIWGSRVDLAQPDKMMTSRARNPDELVSSFSNDLWNYIASQLSHREDAEDVMMDVFATACREFARLEFVDNQLHWLIRIAQRRVADVLRKRYRRGTEGLTGTEPHDGALPSPTALAARSALADLSTPQREVITLKYVNEMSLEEIGQLTNRSVAATNSLLQRARETLRKNLGNTFTQTQGEL